MFMKDFSETIKITIFILGIYVEYDLVYCGRENQVSDFCLFSFIYVSFFFSILHIRHFVGSFSRISQQVFKPHLSDSHGTCLNMA